MEHKEGWVTYTIVRNENSRVKITMSENMKVLRENHIKDFLSNFTDDMLGKMTVPPNYALMMIDDPNTTETARWMMTASTLLHFWRVLRQRGYRLHRVRKAIIFDVVNATGVKRGEIGVVPTTVYQRPGILDLMLVTEEDLIMASAFTQKRTQWPIT